MRYIGLIVMVLMVGSCNLTAPQNAGHAYKFTLSAITHKQSSSAKYGDIVLSFPKADAELDTYRIALLRGAGKRDYFAGARWADFLPVIMQSTLVKTLQNSGYFDSVTADHAAFAADYQLHTDIHLFEVDYTDPEMPMLAINIGFTLVDLAQLEPIGSFETDSYVPLKGSRLTAIYQQFDRSFTEVQQRMLRDIKHRLKNKK